MFDTGCNSGKMEKSLNDGRSFIGNLVKGIVKVHALKAFEASTHNRPGWQIGVTMFSASDFSHDDGFLVFGAAWNAIGTMDTVISAFSI